MSYGVAGAGAGNYGPYPVAGAAENVGPYHPVAGAGYCGPKVGGAFTNVGVILVLFILLVIVARACLF
ncbi:hypothetical protein [Paenibacillus prosopidis]|uniref:Sporulation protein YjcZ n=1 Tax=Paenibacillus prosopidis TaxID=630520 RepID=A0A368VR64_9BACL|nr:hypothetical protein [Paenibacillus prosopidis]RCW44189.1 hypothetical protein DFP97_11252 [Paenibacillus prosopidis]